MESSGLMYCMWVTVLQKGGPFSYFSLIRLPWLSVATNSSIGGGSIGLRSFSPNPQHLARMGFCTTSRLTVLNLVYLFFSFFIFLFYEYCIAHRIDLTWQALKVVEQSFSFLKEKKRENMWWKKKERKKFIKRKEKENKLKKVLLIFTIW